MFLMGNKTKDLTAEGAAMIAKTWDNGAARIIVDGEIYATHQICSIERIKGQELKDLCDKFGIDIKSAPRIDTLSNKNLLT